MSDEIRYDPSAAHRVLDRRHLEEIETRILAARTEVLNDVALLASGEPIPPAKRPLDAGFIELPQQLLNEHTENPSQSLLGRIKTTAAELREHIDRLVLLGIGGSYMGARALFEALCHPYHNELDREQRHGLLRLYFEGNNLDNDAASALLSLLDQRCQDKSDVRQRWGLVVISKSGGTLETAAAFRLFRQALERYYGPDSEDSRRCVIPVTGGTGKLHDLAAAKGYPNVFPIPDDVGGRFSIFTAVGLLPAALLGLNVDRLLQGAADMTQRFRSRPIGDNPVLDYTAACHLLEMEHGMTIRVLSTWGKRLEAVGLWYDQLLAESLGKQEQGATPITTVNTRDLHSRQQQHQQGRRDKLITNLVVETAVDEPIAIPEDAGSNQDDLNKYAGKTLPQFLSAARQATNKALADDDRPTAEITLPKLDEYCLGQLFQMLMLATAVEGRLIGINPYGQPGVEAYKQNMREMLESRVD